MTNVKNIWEGESPHEIRELEAMGDLLAFAPEPVAPGAALRERILARVESGNAPAPETVAAKVREPFMVAAEPGNFSRGRGWKTILPGVHVRGLAREAGYTSTLMRMEADSEYPAHAHEAFEEVCVLEGDCYFDDFVMGPGDYYQARPGTEHGRLRTRNGCVMLITELRRPAH